MGSTYYKAWKGNEMIDYNAIQIAEDQINNYSPYRILVEDTSAMNEVADKKQQAKGKTTYFDYSNPDNDYDGWYNFYFDTNGTEVIQFYYEYMDGEYGDSIDMTDEEKDIVMKKILDYYGGSEEYKKACNNYNL